MEWSPRNGNKSVVVPIPKKGGGVVCKMDEFQGISLVSVANKATCSIIHGKFAQVVEGRKLHGGRRARWV